MLTQEEIRELRKAAAHRRRRIIFDNDGCDAVYYAKEATPEALLKCRTIDIVGTQVDTIVYCTWSSGFGRFCRALRFREFPSADYGDQH